MTRVAILVVLASARVAAASPLADAVAKHDDAAVASLRAQLPGDAPLRCTLGAVYAARGDLARADLYLAGCDAAALDADLAEPVARAIRDTARKLRDSDLAGIDIDIEPERAGGYAAEVDALPGDRFTAPRIIWVPAGHRVVRVYDPTGRAFDTATDMQPHSRGPLLVKLDTPAAAPPRNGVQDFTSDAPPDAAVQGPPPDVKHPPMKLHVLQNHGGDGDTAAVSTGSDADAANPDAIADPLETHATRSALRFGARAGGGVFAETGAPSRLGPSLAAIASLQLVPRVALDLRVDWTRRGSDGTDALGVTLGPTVTALRAAAFDVRAGAGARADLRLESSVVYFPPMPGHATPQLAEVANDANVSAAAWLEVPLRAVPITLAARYERSLTSLGFGVHDQAVIVEAGWELR